MKKNFWALIGSTSLMAACASAPQAPQAPKEKEDKAAVSKSQVYMDGMTFMSAVGKPNGVPCGLTADSEKPVL